MEKPTQIRTPVTGASPASRCPHVSPSIASLVTDVETAHVIWFRLQAIADCAFESLVSNLHRSVQKGAGLSPDATARLKALAVDFETKRNVAMDMRDRKDDALSRLTRQLRLSTAPKGQA